MTNISYWCWYLYWGLNFNLLIKYVECTSYFSLIMQKTSDLRIADRQEVISASTLLSDQPISQESSETVFQPEKAFQKY